MSITTLLGAGRRRKQSVHRAAYFGAMLSIASLPALSQYKCVAPNGSIAFQQQPCALAAQQQKLDVRAPAPPTPAASREKSSVDRQLEAMVADREKRERSQEAASRAQEIVNLENAIANRNVQMDRELALLRIKKGSANNNLAGATWEQSISLEMQAVAQKYKTMNDADLARLSQLRAVR